MNSPISESYNAIPARALYIRVVMAELERLDTHVLWAGIADKPMGFKTMFMICFALREKAMEVPRAISGNCVNGSMDCIGGVNRDLADRGAVLPAVEQLEREMGLFGERNKTQPGLQMGDLIEKRMLDGFHTVPTGRGLLLNSEPGLRCACSPPQHAKTACRGPRSWAIIASPFGRKSVPTMFHPRWVGEAGGRLTGCLRAASKE